jgi:hypothetical protein
MTRILTIATLAFSVLASPAWAQQRPLQTEDPETIGAGRILLEAGVDYERDVFFPLSGLRGNLFTAPSLGVSIGVSSIAEIQVDGGFYQQLRIIEQVPDALFSPLLKVEGQETSDVEDLDLGAKVRFLSETAGRPAMAVRFSTRLPNASNESGLGKDLQDFSVGVLMAKTVQSVRVVANVGLLILGNPAQVADQDDLLTYSLSVARAVSASAELVGEFAGRANFGTLITPGAEDRGLLRFGARYTRSAVRMDAGVQLGLTSYDPEIGFTAGLTWVFNAFRVP